MNKSKTFSEIAEWTNKIKERLNHESIQRILLFIISHKGK